MDRQVYSAAEVQQALGIGRSKVYEFLNEVYTQKDPPFRVIKIGTSVRVQKQSFDDWINGIAG